MPALASLASSRVPASVTGPWKPQSANVALLANMSGTNGATTWTDLSSHAFTINPLNSGGYTFTGSVSNAQTRFGGNSTLLQDDGLYTASDAAFSVGSGAWCFECSFFVDTGTFDIGNGHNCIFSCCPAGVSPGNGLSIWMGSGDHGVTVDLWMDFRGRQASLFSGMSTFLTHGVWYDLCLNCAGGSSITCYINQTEITGGLWGTPPNAFAGGRAMIGAPIDISAYLSFKGHWSNLRFTVGEFNTTPTIAPTAFFTL